MWAGFYLDHPEQAYLTDADKLILLQSPFFFPKRKDDRING